MESFNRFWFASSVPALLGFGLAAFTVQQAEIYGWSLFAVLPVLVGLLSAFLLSFRRQVSLWAAYGAGVASLVLIGILMLTLAFEGLICLAMAFPLALLLALPGTLLGRWLGSTAQGKPQAALPAVLVLAFPLLVAFEQSTTPEAPLRAVTTRVTVAAPIAEAWRTVIAFPQITAPPTGVFRLGIAYPLAARIEGSGVGALRYCEFSTGPFVEPITTWQEPTLLAFDVRSAPAPMQELSPYGALDVPHLHGFLRSEKGQFRLEPASGGTVIEGTTWYRHELSPQWYWGPISDYLIHRIHERVLHHIAETVES